MKILEFLETSKNERIRASSDLVNVFCVCFMLYYRVYFQLFLLCVCLCFPARVLFVLPFPLREVRVVVIR